MAVLRATPGLGTPFELWSAVASALSEVVDPETAETLHRHRADPGALGRDGVPAAVLGAVTGRAAVLVLDDLHHIRCPALLAEVDRMIEKSPGHLGLVLVGRGGLTRPTLHDLYLRGELASVGLKLLAFTRDEVDACCARLSRSGRDRVWEWTQGWPAMVQVLQRALVDGADPASPLGALDGLVDHLFADVFEQIDAATQQLLLLASVVDPMPLHLLVRLADRADAGAVLHEVAQRSGLVDEGLDDEGARSFRLHPLLRGHLRATLDRGDAEAAGIAQVSAARWFRDRGEVIGAVRHAVRAGGQELDKTLAVLGQAGVNEGLAEPLLETIAPRLHDSDVTGWTAAVAAAALADVGRVNEATAMLGRVGPVDGPELQCQVAAVEAHLRRRRGRFRAEDRAAVRQARVPPDLDLAYRVHRGAELLRMGEVCRAESALTAAAELAEGLSRGAALTDAYVMLAGVSAARAEITSLTGRIRTAREAATRSGFCGTSRVAYLHLLSAWGSWQSLRDADALVQARRAAELVQPAEDPTVVVGIRAMLAGRGEGGAADLRWLHSSWQDQPELRLAPDYIAQTAVSDAIASYTAGRTYRLRGVVDGLHERFGERGETLLAAALLRMSRGRHRPALDALEPVLRGEITPVYPATLVVAHAIAADLSIAADHHYRAASEARRAVELADRFGTPRALLSGGRPFIGLLVEGQESWGTREDLVRVVLDHAQSVATEPRPALTRRELEVLHELPTLRTVEEIASGLVVSVNTLKTHLRSLYRKLGVNSRREAVAEARRLGVL